MNNIPSKEKMADMVWYLTRAKGYFNKKHTGNGHLCDKNII